MRIARLLPALACLALAAFAIISPTLPADAWPTPYASPHDLGRPDLLVLFPVEKDHVALAARDEQPESKRPTGDAFALAFAAAKQPGARWRYAADLGFSPIDPHIAAG